MMGQLLILHTITFSSFSLDQGVLLVHFDHLDYWKAITLYGLNVAVTYKPALANCILKEAKKGTSVLKSEDLSSSFLREYISRLNDNKMLQQTNPGRQTKLERIVRH